MSIFEQEPNVNKNSWHYKMLDLVWSDYNKPKTQCTYFWTVVALVLSFPFWGVSAYFSDYKSDSIKEEFGTTLCGFIVFCLVVWAINGFILLIDIGFSLGIFTDEFMFHENGELLPTFAVFFVMPASVEVLLLFGLIVWMLYKFIKFNTVSLVNYTKGKVVRKKNNEYTLTSSFFGWLGDTKNKICKPIKYIDNEE